MENQELLQYIACPVCHGALTPVKREGQAPQRGFACAACQVVYPIEKEIPMLLPESGISMGCWQEGGLAAAPRG